MKLKNKLLSSLVLSSALVISFSTSTLASEKSLEELYNDAKAGISEVDISKIDVDSDLLVTPANSTNLVGTLSLNSQTNPIIESYSTGQVLDDDTVAITTFHDVSVPESKSTGVALLSTGTKPGQKTDATSSVRAYSTIYVNSYTESNIPYKKLTKVTGGWVILDSTVSTSNKKVVYGTGGYPKSYSYTKYPTGLSYTYTATNPGVNINFQNALGTNSTVTLKRGGSTWSLYLQNNW